MIYISTGGISDQPATKTALDFYNHGILNIELSGGTHSENYQAELADLPHGVKLQVHNYFPPAKIPFVFNLASVDAEIAELSVNHVRKAMDLSVVLENRFYAFHAGFRVDPKVSDLGKRLNKKSLLDRKIALEIFAERITLLSDEAEELGVTLLIENNVLSKANFAVYGEDPFLFTSPGEILNFMAQAPTNVGLLLDVAHLKVSSNTLNFNLIDAHEMLSPWIEAYHLSDNDGTKDSNDLIYDGSWFWPYLKKGSQFYTLEIYNTSCAELVAQGDLVAKKLSEIKLS